MIKKHEITLKSGRKLDVQYRFYPGQKATFTDPASSPEVVVHRVVCPEVPWYIASDSEYEEITEKLLAWEARRDDNY